MLEHQHRFSVNRMGAVLRVSRSGYYHWRKHGDKPSLREQKRQARDELIKAAFDMSKERYGATRIQVELASSGESAALKTIADSMYRQSLTPKAARKFKVTNDSNHSLPVAPNLLARNFTASTPNQKWVGDITYLMTSEGWLYLAVIIDLYSRSVVGWSMGEYMTSSLVCDALTMALFRKGNCWDNACTESFFHSLKVEPIQYEPIMTKKEMRQSVFEYIEVDYNRVRRHSALGYLSPENYEKENVA